jgi:hypothetical protein
MRFAALAGASSRTIRPISRGWAGSPMEDVMHAGSNDFDEQKSVTLTGTVKEVNWTDPHVLVRIEAKEAGGQAKNWRIEMGSPAEMAHHGWAADTMKPGDRITIEGNPAKSDPYFASARMVQVPGGRRLSAASECHPT